jgi:hypothetical protein
MMISPCPLISFAIMPQSSMMGRARRQPLEARPQARNMPAMETPRPPILDMTPEGQFNTPPPPSPLDRVLGGVLRVSLVVAGIAGALLLASLALVAIGILLPILAVAALIAGGILWWRLRQARREGRSVQFVVTRRR